MQNVTIFKKKVCDGYVCVTSYITNLFQLQGTTKCFNKYGNYKFDCRTALPGGNPYQINKGKNTVVLDCFYQEEASTMHILDVLAWNEYVMTEGEVSFALHLTLQNHNKNNGVKWCSTASIKKLNMYSNQVDTLKLTIY